METRILVCGAGGFIGSHLLKKLQDCGDRAVGIDLVKSKYMDQTSLSIGDLRDFDTCLEVTKNIDVVYQLAADMGGVGYIGSGNYDFDVMNNSASINNNISKACLKNGASKIVFTSSACVYPVTLQDNINKCINLKESDAYPAYPDMDYGWEKLISERMYLALHRQHGVQVRIARLFNIFGPFGEWQNGREKAPAAICRKVALATDKVEVWGTGEQKRSFLYIDDCIDGLLRLANSNYHQPINLGSDYLVSIQELAKIVIDISGKNLGIKNIDGPVGVLNRNIDNTLALEVLGWVPQISLSEGLAKTYSWITQQIKDCKYV